MVKYPIDEKIINFLSQYSEEVRSHAFEIREIIFDILPDIIEQLDLPAKIIGYVYGQKYSDVICVMIPSKKGLKLGFNRALEMYDPDKLLEGTGKVSRYIQINSSDQIHSDSLKSLLESALSLYKIRKSN